MGSDTDEYFGGERPGRKPSLQARLQSGMYVRYSHTIFQTGVFPGGKVRPGCAADHSPPSSAAVVEEYSYNCAHPLGHTGPVTGLLYLLIFQTEFSNLKHEGAPKSFWSESLKKI